MLRLLYSLSISLLYAGVFLASAVNDKAKRFIRGRSRWRENLKLKVTGISGQWVWVHCASLGEFEQGRPVMEKLKIQFPGIRILLTFFSPSGYEIRKNYSGADVVMYLPLDTRRNAKRFLDLLKPAIAVFIKYEFWYNFITECYRRKIPFISASAIFRPTHSFFQPYGLPLRNMLRKISHFFVQDAASGELLKNIGINQFTVSGDTRFDRVFEMASGARRIETARLFCGESPVIVLGSVWTPDMKLFNGIINNTLPEVKYIIAPHNVNEKDIQEIESNLSVPFIRFSEAETAGSKINGYRVLIIDNIGMLSFLYRYGTIAYVGGAFRGALHNILEAAVYGIPVIIGKHPSNQKFREAAALVKSGGVFEVGNESELSEIITRLLQNKPEYETSASVCRKYVEENTGATGKIISCIGTYISG